MVSLDFTFRNVISTSYCVLGFRFAAGMTTEVEVPLSAPGWNGSGERKVRAPVAVSPTSTKIKSLVVPPLKGSHLSAKAVVGSMACAATRLLMWGAEGKVSAGIFNVKVF